MCSCTLVILMLYFIKKHRRKSSMNISIKYHIPARKLSFANINLTKDNKLFIDPLRIRNGYKGNYHITDNVSLHSF